MPPFVDVSSNNGAIDVKAYANTRMGVLRQRPRWFSRKVTEGTGYHWTDGDRYANQAHGLGLHVMHYHWLRPDENAREQAAYYVEQMRGELRPGDVGMCDFEATAGAGDGNAQDRASQLISWMVRVRELMPALPLIVYTGNWYVDRFGGDGNAVAAAVRRYPVVLADYSNRKPPNPHRFHVVAHQFSDRYRFAGLSAGADANRWMVDPIELFRFHR